MKHNVLNNKVGSPYSFDYERLTKEKEREIVASIFEQLLIFDSITITTNRVNFALMFLIKQIGINNVEKLIERGYVKFMIWTPFLFTSNGREGVDGKIDESIIYGKPPIVAGTLCKDDIDPEKNIEMALSQFNIPRGRKRSFKKKALNNYIIPKGIDYSSASVQMIIDAYKSNNLAELGLPYNKEPEQLNVEERMLIQQLGQKVLETAVMSEYSLKSLDNYEHIEICKKSFENIGKAYNVVDNTSEILKIENLPNLKEFYLQEKLDFESMFRLRHLSSAKYYRKWINNIGENANAQEITKEYLNEIKGKNSFFEANKGKLVKSSFMFGVGVALGTILPPIISTLTNGALGLFDTFVLDNMLKGKKPSMFIGDLETHYIKNKK
ncbi:hypothetical protein PG357_03855 [Riemerella anatipestifer]|nr:hypothetical protein [Riemerella anatipestifer]